MRLILFSALSFVMAAACVEETVAEDDSNLVLTGVGGGASSSSAGVTSSTAAAQQSASSSSASSVSSSSAASSSSSGVSCSDFAVGEPNQSESQAHQLKTMAIGDCDGDGGQIKGVMREGDADWFYYEGDDGIGCTVDPTRALSPGGEGLRLCKYFECLSGDTSFSCPNGTKADTSPEGRKGCCGAAGFDVGDLGCSGTTDEHAYVYIRIDHPTADATTCIQYTLDYHY